MGPPRRRFRVLQVAGALGAFVCARPAFAQETPLLDGAAFAASDISPITGPTELQFVPGHGLIRTPLDRHGRKIAPPKPLQLDAARRKGVVYAEAFQPSAVAIRPPPLGAPSMAMGLIDRLAHPPVQAFKRPRVFVFLSAGDRAVTFSVMRTTDDASAPGATSIEKMLLRSNYQAGLGWRYGDNSAFASVLRTKDQFLAAGEPKLTEDRVAVTLMREVK